MSESTSEYCVYTLMTPLASPTQDSCPETKKAKIRLKEKHQNNKHFVAFFGFLNEMKLTLSNLSLFACTHFSSSDTLPVL